MVFFPPVFMTGGFLMKKCKKILFIVPIIFTMILSLAAPLCSFAATYTIDNTLINYFLALGSHSDILSFEEHSSFDVLSSGFSGSYIYIRGVSCDPTYQSVKCESFLFKADDASYSVEDDGTYCFSFSSTPLCNRYERTFYFNSSGSYSNFSTSSSDGFLSYSINTICYNPDTNIVSFYSGSSLTYSFEFYSGLYEIFDTNVVDLDALDVTVIFKPDLNGNVDRTVTDSNGNEGLAQSMTMTVNNNSSFAIQYYMAIYNWTDTTSDPIFIYYSNAWVYSYDISSKDSFLDESQVKLTNKATQFHYLSAGASEIVTFNFNQLNLKEKTLYYVTVKAVKCDYDHASLNFVNSDPSEVDSDTFQISRSLEECYSGWFNFLQYSDITYDHSSSSNGVLPFDGSNGSTDDSDKYALSRNAVLNDDGSIDYTSLSLLEDGSSWWVTGLFDQVGSDVAADLTNIFDSLGLSNNSYNYSSSDSDINSLSSSFTQYFRFLNTAFHFFPIEYITLITLGLTSIVILAILRTVLK